MRAAIVLFILAIGFPALATPQTSDADLKAAQVPVLQVQSGSNFRGLRISVTGNLPTMELASCNASGIDFAGLTGVGVLNCSDNPATVFDLSAFFSYVDGGQFPSQTNFSGCNLTDAQLAGFVAAMGVVTTNQGSVSSEIDLEGNSFTTLDVSGVAVVQVGMFDLSGNAGLTTIVAGDGTTSGFTGCTSAINCSGCALTVTAENNLLGALAAMQANTSDTFSLDISGGASAAPDGTGAGFVSTLVGAGCTVTTN